jgi:ABC-2 type transport system permease protein
VTAAARAVAGLGHVARGSLAFTRLDALVLAQYRASFAVWACSHAIQAVVAIAVWGAVAGSNGGTTGGYDAAAFAGYFLAMLVMRELTFTGLVYHLPNRVRTGKVAIQLLRPLHPLVQSFGSSFANVLQSLVMVVPIAVVLAILLDARVEPTPAAVVATIVLIPFALLARACADALVATTSFWLVRIDGIRSIYFFVTLIVGGLFAPLALLPDWLAALSRALPFYWSLGFPVELFVGRASVHDAPIAAAVLAAWSIVLLAVLQPVWRAGTRAYEAVGQ